MSPDEHSRINKTNRFQIVGGAEGKYFAEKEDHAIKWGKTLMGSGNFHIVKVRFSKEIADRFHRWPMLDGIGPARFARMDQLTQYTIML